MQRHVPIYASTSAVMEHKRDECLHAAMDGVSDKPLRIADLSQLARAILPGSLAQVPVPQQRLS